MKSSMKKILLAVAMVVVVAAGLLVLLSDRVLGTHILGAATELMTLGLLLGLAIR